MTLNFLIQAFFTLMAIYAPLSLGASEAPSAEFGSILIYENGTPKVDKLEISTTHEGILQNKFVTFLNAPNLGS